MPKLSFQYVRQGESENLLAFLERRFRYHSAEEWKERIRKGFVKVNGKRCKPGQILETRHKIAYEPPPEPEPEIDRAYDVIYEDEQILAVGKSGNIPTSPSGKYWHNCLTHVLKNAMGLEWLHAVHRLDRETSGINLFAKSKEAARRLGKDFQEGRVNKSYTAVLQGVFPLLAAYVSAPLRDAEQGTIRIKQAADVGGRGSQTRFELQARLPGGASLVAAIPMTGRTHQIRAHASLLGYPVVGDKLYGTTEEAFLHWVSDKERNSASRQLLHATTLSFAHPSSGKTMHLESPARQLVQLYLDQHDSSRCGGKEAQG